ncbi:response regulator [Devosia sp.]|uniref:response regulator n=1 Tax=Devosia sp. TaxID=1871048 RepID=UPI003262E80F
MQAGNGEVLVVEDEPLVALMIEDMLTDMGFTVAAVVHTEPAAQDALAKHRPRLAILDFELGRGNSLDLIAQCRTNGTAVIVATGHTAAELPEECRDSPILTKPFSIEQLSAALEQALASAR